MTDINSAAKYLVWGYWEPGFFPVFRFFKLTKFYQELFWNIKQLVVYLCITKPQNNKL